MENLILRAFSQEARGFLAEYALRRPVATGEVLYADKMPFTHAVFPHTGIISLMGQRENRQRLPGEKAAIGNEGSFLALRHDDTAGIHHGERAHVRYI